MDIEIRADGLHISGYVNVTGKQSNPVITSHGKVNEVIEERAFERALEKSDNIPMTLDHNSERVLAQTSDKTLSLTEDAIGLRAETVVNDEEVIKNVKKLRGWSFGMREVVDSIEERADKLPLRHVKGFVLDHVTLVMNKRPCYSATSLEIRADSEEPLEIETRTMEHAPITIKETIQEPIQEPINYSKFENRLLEIKVGL